MEPRVRYARAADGVSIAYWTLGEGMPVVQMPHVPGGNIHLEWRDEDNRLWYERMARDRMLVRYDHRGNGLSERGVSSVDASALTLDIEAVIDDLKLTRFVLIAPIWFGPLGLAFAAQNPDRVSHLILWCTFPRSPTDSRLDALNTLQQQDWTLFTQTVGLYAFGWEQHERASRLAAQMRESITPELYGQYSDELDKMDATELLEEIQAPTLITHRREVVYPSLESSMEMASKISGAHLAVFEGTSLAPWVGGESEEIARTVDEFLGEEKPKGRRASAERDVHTIIFTDVAGSTQLTQRLGDRRARDLLQEHERITRAALTEHGGMEIKTLGDGFMATFASASRALDCAISLQRAFTEHNSSADERMEVRVGLNAGEPIEDEEDLFGTAVIMASRIAAKAKGGEILASNVVRELVAGRPYMFSDRGEVALRGFEDPARLFEVRWEEAGEDRPNQ